MYMNTYEKESRRSVKIYPRYTRDKCVANTVESLRRMDKSENTCRR